MTSSDEKVIEAIRRLQVERDEDLQGTTAGPEARSLLSSILAEPIERPEGNAPGRRWWRRRGTALFVLGGTLALAGGAGAFLIGGNDGPPSRDELRAGRSNGVLQRSQNYVNVRVRQTATAAELKRKFEQLGFDVRLQLVPASPLLVGRILSASGDGGGETIRELRRDCPQATPCGRYGLKVPSGFEGSAAIALGRTAKPRERYVFAESFQGTRPGCLGLGGLRAREASRLIESNLWPQANPLWYDVDTDRTYDEAKPVANLRVVDVVKAGGSLDKPSRSRPPRVLLAVSRARVDPPEPIRSGPLAVIQRITQQGC